MGTIMDMDPHWTAMLVLEPFPLPEAKDAEEPGKRSFSLTCQPPKAF